MTVKYQLHQIATGHPFGIYTAHDRPNFIGKGEWHRKVLTLQPDQSTVIGGYAIKRLLSTEIDPEGEYRTQDGRRVVLMKPHLPDQKFPYVGAVLPNAPESPVVVTLYSKEGKSQSMLAALLLVPDEPDVTLEIGGLTTAEAMTISSLIQEQEGDSNWTIVKSRKGVEL